MNIGVATLWREINCKPLPESRENVLMAQTGGQQSEGSEKWSDSGYIPK